jgi:uncharacterized protein YkwD
VMPWIITAALLSLALAGPVRACPNPPDLPALQAELIRSVNAERRARGLAPLTAAPELTSAAQGLACDNAARRRISHTGANGSTLKSRLAAQGYRFANAAENAAAGYPDPAAVTAGWMRSPGHRRNILSPPLRDIGVGIATGTDGQIYWIIDLGLRR